MNLIVRTGEKQNAERTLFGNRERKRNLADVEIPRANASPKRFKKGGLHFHGGEKALSSSRESAV